MADAREVVLSFISSMTINFFLLTGLPVGTSVAVYTETTEQANLCQLSPRHVMLGLVP